MSEKLAVLNCGGTIAMMPGKDGALAPELTGDQLIANMPNLGDMGAEFDVIDVFNKDSTNVGPEDWTTLTDRD